MDEVVYAIGLIVPGIFSLLSILAKTEKYGGFLLGGITAIFGIGAIYVFLGVGSDGDLTSISSGSVIQVASATLNANTWYFITFFPLVMALLAFISALYRVFK